MSGENMTFFSTPSQRRLEVFGLQAATGLLNDLTNEQTLGSVAANVEVTPATPPSVGQSHFLPIGAEPGQPQTQHA